MIGFCAEVNFTVPKCPTRVIQLATPSAVVVYDVSQIKGLPPYLLELLANPNVIKVSRSYVRCHQHHIP